MQAYESTERAMCKAFLVASMKGEGGLLHTSQLKYRNIPRAHPWSDISFYGCDEGSLKALLGVLQRRGRIQSNGLLQGGDPGTYGRRGRGLTATISFSSSRPPSNSLPSSHLNGSVSASTPGSSAAEEAVIGALPLSKKAQEMDNLSVLCALRQSCVMLTPETSLVEALEVSHPSHVACPLLQGLAQRAAMKHMWIGKCLSGYGNCFDHHVETSV